MRILILLLITTSLYCCSKKQMDKDNFLFRSKEIWVHSDQTDTLFIENDSILYYSGNLNFEKEVVREKFTYHYQLVQKIECFVIVPYYSSKFLANHNFDLMEIDECKDSIIIKMPDMVSKQDAIPAFSFKTGTYLAIK